MMSSVVLFAYLLILLETTSAQASTSASAKTKSGDKVLCPCVEEAENGNIDRNVGFYFIPLMTNGYKYSCASMVIKNTQPNPEPGRRKLPIGAGFEERQVNGGTGIQSWVFQGQSPTDKNNVTKISGFHYRINKKRFVTLQEQMKADVVNILAQDDDPNKGFILELHCLITEGIKSLFLKTRKPNPDQKIFDLANKKAKEFGIKVDSVKQDQKCDYNKQIWTDLNF